MKHEKKVWPEFFELIFNGVKKYDLRLADWDCKEGDILVLREWDPKTGTYTGREIEKKVTMVRRTKDFTFWSEEDIEKYGYQVISFD